MKETILKKASEFFLKFGFKSVTMDDIANELAVSKKTIYKFFKNKTELVNETIAHTQKCIHNAISCICNSGHNAIQENFEINKKVKELLNQVDESPMYQLQKYYPEIFNKITADKYEMFKDCISKNLEKGIHEGLYRKNINIDLITKFYFSLKMSLHDSNIHSYTKNTITVLELQTLEYHIRSIATEKGIKILEQQLQQNVN